MSTCWWAKARPLIMGILIGSVQVLYLQNQDRSSLIILALVSLLLIGNVLVDDLRVRQGKLLEQCYVLASIEEAGRRGMDAGDWVQSYIDRVRGVAR